MRAQCSGVLVRASDVPALALPFRADTTLLGAPLSLNPTFNIHDEIGRRLRELEQRYTTGRRAIVDVLDSAERPLTVPEIVGRARPGALPVSSAYRNLTALEEAGVVHRVVGTDDHGRYELAEHLAGHHHHLLCGRCGEVSDVSAYPRLEQALDDAARVARDETGFEVTGHRIDLLGICKACSA